MAVYWHDSRERHGSGRRYLQPQGELSKGLGGGYAQDPPSLMSSARGNPYAGLQARQNSYGGAASGDIAANARDAPAEAAAADLAADALQESAPAVASRASSLRDEQISNGGKAPSVQGQNSRQASDAGPPGGPGGFEMMPPLSEAADQGAVVYTEDPDGLLVGRRHFEHQGHMQDAGTSAPDVGRHGRGRRYFEPGDHEVINQDARVRQQAVDEFNRPSGRRNIPVVDTVKTHLRTPLQEGECSKVPSCQEMKDSVREWLTTAHNMAVVDESLWNNEVQLKPRGCHWVAEAICPKRKTLSREGQSARFLAEKLSMMPVQELRHFGLRFRAGEFNQKKPVALETNRSLVSLGMHGAMGQEDEGYNGPHLSNMRPYEGDHVHRRYIASGKDHFAAQAQPSGDSPGHTMDSDFADGIERGIGHGKRYIGTQDNVSGVLG